MSDDAVSASAKGATFLILLQIGSRAVTFALNQVLLRFLSPELLGVAVQLELYIISTLYFSRESLRIATQRRSDGGVQAAVNLSYLALAAGVPVSFAFARVYLSSRYPDLPYVVEALRINQLAALVELCSEPAFVAVQQNMLFKVRAGAEAAAVVMKTLTTAGLVFYGHYAGVDFGVLPFALGELAFSTSMSALFLFRTASVAREKGFSLWPVKRRSSPELPYVLSVFSKPLLVLSASLYLQTAIKWALTEGDKILITPLATLKDQGLYALSANYGGLIARMLFKPVEESCRNLFASLCGSPQGSVKPPPSRTERDEEKDGSAAQRRKNLGSASNVLRDILRFYSIISLVAFAVGPAAAPLLLRLVAGSRWSESGAGEVLGTYCYYIPFMALNGVSEAFVAVTASTAELQLQSFWMAGFTAAFVGCSYLFLAIWGLGAKGLVYANCVNMGMRIVFNLHFVTRFFGSRGLEFPLSTIVPNTYAVAAAAVVPSVLSQSQKLTFLHPYGLLGDLLRVGAIGAAYAAFVGASERRFLVDAYRRFRS